MRSTAVAQPQHANLKHPVPPSLPPPPRPPLQSLCGAANEVIEATLAAAANKDPEDEPPLDVVAVLYSDKTAGEIAGVAGLVFAAATRRSLYNLCLQAMDDGTILSFHQ